MPIFESGEWSDRQDSRSVSITSKDGTRIGCDRCGAGPVVILVQGAMGATHSYRELAKHLASDFTVYVPERRARPLSPRSFSPDHCVDREVEAPAAVFERSGAGFLFGLSSSAVIALDARRVHPDVRKLVLYELPLCGLPRQMRLDLVARYGREVEDGELLAALVSASWHPTLLRRS